MEFIPKTATRQTVASEKAGSGNDPDLSTNALAPILTLTVIVAINLREDLPPTEYLTDHKKEGAGPSAARRPSYRQCLLAIAFCLSADVSLISAPYHWTTFAYGFDTAVVF